MRAGRILLSSIIMMCTTAVHAGIVGTEWTPIFKGIEHSAGTNSPDTSIPGLQVANCLRIDLSDPDVQLFTTPRASNYVANSSETYSMSVSNFLVRQHLQVATVANFYASSQGGADPTSEGVPCQVYGLAMCTGQVVSVPEPSDGRTTDSNNRYVSLLFTTNKTPFLVLSNGPPGT